MNIKKEIMEEFREKFYLPKGIESWSVQGTITEHLDFLSQALTRIEEAITYDNISIGWDHDCHYRYVFAIQNGQIIYKERVSDDSISHLDVVRQIDIENYVKSKLPPSEEKEPKKEKECDCDNPHYVPGGSTLKGEKLDFGKKEKR